MPHIPSWRLQTFGSEIFFALDWRETFRGHADVSGIASVGAMRGFCVVFRLRAEITGRFVVRASGATLIRVNGATAYAQPDGRQLSRLTLCIATGDRLEVAQSQPPHRAGDWLFAIRGVGGEGALLQSAEDRVRFIPIDLGCQLSRVGGQAFADDRGPVSAACPLG